MQIWAWWAVLSGLMQGAAAVPGGEPGPGLLQLAVDEATGGRMAIAVASEAGAMAKVSAMAMGSGPEFGAEAGTAPRAVGFRARPPGKRRSRGMVSLKAVTLNVSGWGTLKRLLGQLTLDAEVVMAQEIKLGTFAEISRAKKWLAQQGWWSSFAPCIVGPGGGRSAGVLVLARKHLDVVNAGVTIAEGRARSMTIRLRAIGLVELISVYAKDGVGIAGNKELLGSIVEHVRANGRPALIGGDFNVPPAVLQAFLDESNV